MKTNDLRHEPEINFCDFRHLLFMIIDQKRPEAKS